MDLAEGLNRLRRNHVSRCNPPGCICGADEANALIDELLAEVQHLAFPVTRHPSGMCWSASTLRTEGATVTTAEHKVDWSQLDARIAAERQRRLTMARAGHPYEYWRERGDKEPNDGYWCNHCAGYFGVPHDFQTHDQPLCRNIHTAMDRRPTMCRQCACIDCVVAEAMVIEASMAET